MPKADAGVTYEVDPEYLEHARREDTTGGIAGDISGGDQPELLWDA